MGIEKLKGSLLVEASEEARKIMDSAEAHVQSMLDEERSKRSSMKKDAEKEIDKSLEEQRNERLAWGRLESRRILAEAREDAITEVLEEFFDALGKARKSPDYKAFLNKAVAEASSDLGSGIIVHLSKGEKSMVPVPKGAKVVEDLEGLGGALIESSDGKVRMDYTMETMFESRKDEIRKQIYEKMFGGK